MSWKHLMKGKRMRVTEEMCRRGQLGKHFRCYLCGHEFQPGHHIRLVRASNATFINPKDGKTYGLPNLLVCSMCDKDDETVRAEWVKMAQTAYTKYWWFLED